MERLIYRDEALLLITDLPVNSTDAETLQRCIEVISNMTTVDAVEVVRCKDCKWGREISGNIECFADKNAPSEYHGYEWFCPNGERRTDE